MTLPTTDAHEVDFAHQTIGQPQRQQQNRSLVQSSFPARLAKILAGCAVAVPKHVSEALLADAARHTADVAALKEKAKFNLAQINQALAEAAEAAADSDLFVAAENFKMNRLDEAKRTVQLWADSLSLSRRLEAELAALSEPLETELARVTGEVRAALTTIGCGPDAFPATIRLGVGSPLAVRQFEYFVRQNNTRTRAAFTALTEATDALAQAHSAVRRAKAGLAAANQFAAGELRRAVGDIVS